MAVIGATQLEPVNILGSYVQGTELGRANQLRLRQQAAEERALLQAQQVQNALAAGDRNALMRLGEPGLAAVKTLSDLELAELTQKKTKGEIEKQERDMQLQGLRTAAQFATSAIEDPTTYPAAYQQALQFMPAEQLAAMGITEQYDEKALRRVSKSLLSEADRLDAQLRGRTADIQERQVRVAERKQALEERTAGAGEAGMVKPPSLQKGERWNPEAQRVEAVEGSDIYIKQSGKHNKDLSAVNAINNQRDLAIGKLDKLLAEDNRDAFNNLFGGYGAYVTRELSGKTANLRSDLESLKNNLKAAGKKIISSAGPGAIGQITEREWPILEGMIAELRPTMSVEGEGGAREKLQEIKVFMDNLAAQAADEYETTWGRTQFYKQPKGRSSAAAPTRDVMSEADAILGL